MNFQRRFPPGNFMRALVTETTGEDKANITMFTGLTVIVSTLVFVGILPSVFVILVAAFGWHAGWIMSSVQDDKKERIYRWEHRKKQNRHDEIIAELQETTSYVKQLLGTGD